MLKILCLLLLTPPLLFADRWLILPPRVELQSQQTDAASLARAMALYLKASRFSEIVSVAEAETCLKNSNISMAGKVAPNALAQVAKDCMAERMLLTRIRMRQNKYEITTKVYYRESASLTDTYVTTGTSILSGLGAHLTQRFNKSPASPKEASTDLIIAGDTYGGGYYDWLQFKNLLLGLDSVKTSYCLTTAAGQTLTLKSRADRSVQKDFFDKLRFEGTGGFSNTEPMLSCVREATNVARHEGRKALTLWLVSQAPHETRARIQLRAQVRSLARQGHMLIVTASTANSETHQFWMKLAREISSQATFIPSAQRAKIGLVSGQEWYVYRRAGRLYESREADVKRFEKGVEIPENTGTDNSLQGLISLYEQLSKNKVISRGTPAIYIDPIQDSLTAAFKTEVSSAAEWRILIQQNDVSYYISTTAADAQKFKINEFARVFLELKAPTENQLVRNRISPVIVISNAVDSAISLEIDIRDYMRNPKKYLRRSFAGRSFYIVTGKVLSINPPAADSFDNAF